jgi:hypothetical protein
VSEHLHVGRLDLGPGGAAWSSRHSQLTEPELPFLRRGGDRRVLVTRLGTFPGRDGDLVVATGAGLELVVPATGVASAVCSNVLVCRDPAQPSFSPNGQAIAFVDRTSGRPTAASGSSLQSRRPTGPVSVRLDQHTGAADVALNVSGELPTRLIGDAWVSWNGGSYVAACCAG